MNIRTSLLAGVGIAAACGLLAGPAQAGPCSTQIEEVAAMLGGPSGKEGGTLSGATPGTIQPTAPASSGTPTTGAADQSAGGEGGKEMGTYAGNAPGSMEKPVDPAAGKATSAQDVRLQQQGMPTVAQGGNPAALDQRHQQAQAALDEARTLDQQGSQDCMGKLEEARRLLGS